MEQILKRINEFKKNMLTNKNLIGGQSHVTNDYKKKLQTILWSNLFDDDFFPVVSQRSTSIPAVNIKEDEKRFVLDLAVSGIDKKDLKIEIHEDDLTISSENNKEKEETHDGFKRREFRLLIILQKFLPS